MLTEQELQIIEYLKMNPGCSSRQIYNGALLPGSYATAKRTLSRLVDAQLLSVSGQGKGTRYSVSTAYQLLLPIDMELYYQQEIDERTIITHFNSAIITDTLRSTSVFTVAEMDKVAMLHERYQSNIQQLSKAEYDKELERLAIDLSWKSSQIEGNTYSLLETERLLKERETASGKSKDEAVMLLNHKEAIDFIVAHPDYLVPLSVNRIEDIHSILTKELSIERNLRRRRVGISGTNYRPLDNEFQIAEALSEMCELVNSKTHPLEKALLALLLISYIQPFVDGNKRTARIVSNAILMNDRYCPISFRTVESIEYKKAILLFYEQNNISAFKRIYLDQYEFAVNTYF